MKHVPLVTGSRGRLGRALADVIETEHADRFPEAVFATRDELDILDYFRVVSELERIRPTVVINCAAYAHVDGCETHRDLAERMNDAGARNVARASRQVGARIIQVSTDLVFDGRQGGPPRPYREEDDPRPLSHYAATKLAGERAVADENPDHVILRSSWFFGPWPVDRYPESFLAMLERRERFFMVSDRLGSPTYLRDLARAIVRVVETPYEGILHYANSGEPTSRYHLLVDLADRLGIDAGGMTPIADAEWSGDAAPRPAYSALDPSAYARLTGDLPRTWEETLREYIDERDA